MQKKHRRSFTVFGLVAAIYLSAASAQEVNKPEQPPMPTTAKTVMKLWPGVAPGGGFIGLSINSEGHDVAKWLVTRGIAAFVLKY